MSVHKLCIISKFRLLLFESFYLNLSFSFLFLWQIDRFQKGTKTIKRVFTNITIEYESLKIRNRKLTLPGMIEIEKTAEARTRNQTSKFLITNQYHHFPTKKIGERGKRFPVFTGFHIHILYLYFDGLPKPGMTVL